jgi:response regulator RpfG family c-di-GMP phosphodiesterase
VQARDGRRRKQFLRYEVSTEPPRFPWPNLSGIHAFVIDDNEDTRLVLAETLEHCGAVVTAYASADACIADLGEVVPTVFVCDLSMPNLDGFSSCGAYVSCRRSVAGGFRPSP